MAGALSSIYAANGPDGKASAGSATRAILDDWLWRHQFRDGPRRLMDTILLS